MWLFIRVSLVLVAVIVVASEFVTTANVVAEEGVQAQEQCEFVPFTAVDDALAAAWQVTNSATGDVLGAHNPQAVLSFASVVKLLTASAVLTQPSVYTDLITLTPDDIATEGRAGNLQSGEVYTAHELLFPLLLTSSNDAGATLSRMYPTLVAEMQEFAMRVGADATTIVDTTGLSTANQTTVSDLSLIVRALFAEAPHIFDITRTSQYVSRFDNGWLNNIPFRTLAGYQGGKQGFLYEARQTGVAVVTTTGPAPVTLVITVLGAEDVAQAIAQLQQAATEAYECHVPPSVVPVL